MDHESGLYDSKEEDKSSSNQNGNASESAVETDSDQRSPRSASLTTLSWVVLYSSLLLAEMQAALDSTITANLQPIIIQTFGEIAKFPWINVTYSLGMGGSCLLWYVQPAIGQKDSYRSSLIGGSC